MALDWVVLGQERGRELECQLPMRNHAKFLVQRGKRLPTPKDITITYSDSLPVEYN